MNLLIIGSKGFIGSNLVQYFSNNEKYVVYGCDIINDLTSKNYFSIDKFNGNFFEIFAQVKFDICINCSGAASVPDSFLNVKRDYQLNTLNVFHFLDSIKENSPLCKFINLSSAAVYGNPSKLPVSELNALNPLSPYAFHKLQAELLCEEFNRLYGVSTCSLRIFSAYGVGLTKQLFWDVWQKIQSSKHIVLFGKGIESRDFINIIDIGNIIQLVIDNGNFSASVYNVANGTEIFVKDAVKKFCEYAGWDGAIEFVQKERKGDPVNWCADISKIKDIGYNQKVSFEEGINKYVQWVRKLA